jgi:transcriptional regulator GlxA family with amidase domain
MSKRAVLIVAPPLATLQDVTGAWEVFCRVERYAPGTYDVTLVSTGPELQVQTKFGLKIICEHSVHEFQGPLDTVLVTGSEEGVAGRADPAFLDWLKKASRRTRRMGSICTGAFYLAHAGLLAGRRATSHWRQLERLADEFPDVAVDPDPIFIRDGDVYTSAGVTAGIDLALALVEADCGHSVSQAIARDLVLFLQRQADQPQLSTALAQRMADRDPIRHLQRWAPDNLDALSTVEDMAAYVHMSPRNFARLFKLQTGVTPGHYIRQLRLEAARRRMEELSGNAEAVAAQVGFGSTRSLRRSLRCDARSSSRKT